MRFEMRDAQQVCCTWLLLKPCVSDISAHLPQIPLGDIDDGIAASSSWHGPKGSDLGYRRRHMEASPLAFCILQKNIGSCRLCQVQALPPSRPWNSGQRFRLGWMGSCHTNPVQAKEGQEVEQ